MSWLKASFTYNGIKYDIQVLDQDSSLRFAAQFDQKFPDRFKSLLQVNDESQLPQDFDADQLIKDALKTDKDHAKRAIFYKVTGIELTPELEKFMNAQRFGKQTIIQLLEKTPVETIEFCVLGAIEQHYENFKNQIFSLFENYITSCGFSASSDILLTEFAHICQLDHVTINDLPSIGYGSYNQRMEDNGIPESQKLSLVQPVANSLVNLFVSFRAAALNQPFFAYATGNLMDSEQYGDQWAPIAETVQRLKASGKPVYDEKTFKTLSKDSLLQYCRLDALNYPFLIDKMWGVKTSDEYFMLDKDNKTNLLAKIRAIIETYYPDGKGLQNIVLAERLSDLNNIWEKQLYYFYNSICKRQNHVFFEILKDGLLSSKELGGDRDEKTTEELLEALPKGRKYPDVEYDPIFNFTFDSKDENDIVNKFRNDFHIQCVPSNIEIPCVDESPNEKKFKIDFVLYCDVLESFGSLNINNQNVRIPRIKPQVILVGEYFGGTTGTRPELKRTLLNIDGSVYEKNGSQYIKGMQNVPEPDIYKVRTSYKKMIESFAAKTIGCSTISISANDDDKDIIQELDHNNVIFVPNGKIYSIMPDTSALKLLIKWFAGQPQDIKQYISDNAAELQLDKYLQFANLIAIPRAANAPMYDKYLSLIAHEIERVKFKAFDQTIGIKRTNYNRASLYPIYLQKQKLEREMIVIKGEINKAFTNHDHIRVQSLLPQLSELKKQMNDLYVTDHQQKYKETYNSNAINWKTVQLNNLYNQVQESIKNGEPVDPNYVKLFIDYCLLDSPQKLAEFIQSYKKPTVSFNLKRYKNG